MEIDRIFWKPRSPSVRIQQFEIFASLLTSLGRVCGVLGE